MDAIPRQASAVVIGAGPMGLTAASLLATYGVTPIVLEKALQPFDLPRAIVLDDEGARALQVIGLHDSYVSGANAAVGSAYFDETGVGRAGLSSTRGTTRIRTSSRNSIATANARN